jgi:hypothetical protein
VFHQLVPPPPPFNLVQVVHRSGAAVAALKAVQVMVLLVKLMALARVALRQTRLPTGPVALAQVVLL